MRTLGSTLLLAAAGMTLSACGEPTGVGTDASLRVLLTDAPIAYIEEALVDIGAVELLPAGDGEHIVLSEDGTDGPIDLLELRDAATMVLAEADIEAGVYAQIRLIVESASVTLKEGYEFNDGTTEMALFVPSGAQTGIKLNLGAADDEEGGEGGFQIAPGETILVLDFDVSQSFVIQGNPETPAGIFGVLFTPAIRVVAGDLSGSIAGTVSTEEEGVSVEGLTVTAEPVDEGTLEGYQTETATAVTNADGEYTLNFLVPGTYEVTVATPTGLVTQPDTADVTVEVGEDVADVDFVIVPSS